MIILIYFIRAIVIFFIKCNYNKSISKMLPIKKLNSKGNAKYDTINDVGFEFKNDFLQKGTSSKMS
jgi:hypothetical protein